LFFPGKPPDDDDGADNDLESDLGATVVSEFPRKSDLEQDREDSESVATSSADSRTRIDDASARTSVTSTSSFGPSSPLLSLGTGVAEAVAAIKEENESEEPESKSLVEESRRPPQVSTDETTTEATVRPARHSHSVAPLVSVSKALGEASRRKSAHGSPLIPTPHGGGIVQPQLPQLNSRAESTGKRASVAESASTHSTNATNSASPVISSSGVTPLAGMSTTSLHRSSVQPSLPKLSIKTSTERPPMNETSPTNSPLAIQSPILPPPPTPPRNPRDHSLLEFIYSEMLASRFINVAPLSLLANTLGIHFKGG
jgi:hypothetical protein